MPPWILSLAALAPENLSRSPWVTVISGTLSLPLNSALEFGRDKLPTGLTTVKGDKSSKLHHSGLAAEDVMAISS